MTPAEKAKVVCERAGGNFREVVEAHMLLGYLFVTPELFVAARAVPSQADLSDLWREWPREECNAWFVWIGVGDMWRALKLMPYELPLVGWYRAHRGWSESRWVPTNLLQRRAPKFESALAQSRRTCYSDTPHGRLS